MSTGLTRLFGNGLDALWDDEPPSPEMTEKLRLQLEAEKIAREKETALQQEVQNNQPDFGSVFGEGLGNFVDSAKNAYFPERSQGEQAVTKDYINEISNSQFLKPPDFNEQSQGILNITGGNLKRVADISTGMLADRASEVDPGVYNNIDPARGNEAGQMIFNAFQQSALGMPPDVTSEPPLKQLADVPGMNYPARMAQTVGEDAGGMALDLNTYLPSRMLQLLQSGQMLRGFGEGATEAVQAGDTSPETLGHLLPLLAGTIGFGKRGIQGARTEGKVRAEGQKNAKNELIRNDEIRQAQEADYDPEVNPPIKRNPDFELEYSPDSAYESIDIENISKAPTELNAGLNLEGDSRILGKEAHLGNKRAQSFVQSKLPHEQPVKVTFPDGEVHYDSVKGMNQGHALVRAQANWEGATIEPVDTYSGNEFGAGLNLEGPQRKLQLKNLAPLPEQGSNDSAGLWDKLEGEKLAKADVKNKKSFEDWYKEDWPALKQDKLKNEANQIADSGGRELAETQFQKGKQPLSGFDSNDSLVDPVKLNAPIENIRDQMFKKNQPELSRKALEELNRHPATSRALKEVMAKHGLKNLNLASDKGYFHNFFETDNPNVGVRVNKVGYGPHEKAVDWKKNENIVQPIDTITVKDSSGKPLHQIDIVPKIDSKIAPSARQIADLEASLAKDGLVLSDPRGSGENITVKDGKAFVVDPGAVTKKKSFDDFTSARGKVSTPAIEKQRQPFLDETRRAGLDLEDLDDLPGYKSNVDSVMKDLEESGLGDFIPREMRGKQFEKEKKIANPYLPDEYTGKQNLGDLLDAAEARSEAQVPLSAKQKRQARGENAPVKVDELFDPETGELIESGAQKSVQPIKPVQSPKFVPKPVSSVLDNDLTTEQGSGRKPGRPPNDKPFSKQGSQPPSKPPIPPKSEGGDGEGGDKETPSKFLDNPVVKIFNSVKSIAYGGDVGHLLRQGKQMNVDLLFSRKAGDVVKQFPVIVKAAKSEKFFNDFHENLYKDPDIKLATDEFGLDMPGVGKGHLKEEVFHGSSLENVPVVGKYYAKPSERVYTAGLNFLRASEVKKNFESLRKRGFTPEKDPAKFQGVARAINIISQRGQFKPGTAKLLADSSFFFGAPRAKAARVQNLVELFRGGESGTVVRRTAAKMLVFNLGMMGIMKAARPDGEIVTDDKRSDFGKFRDGDITLDPSAGLGTSVRTALAIKNGEKESPYTGKTYDVSPGDAVTQELANMTAPGIRAAWILMTGKDLGSYLTRGSKQAYEVDRIEALKAILPMTPVEITDLLRKEDGIEKLIYAAMMSFGEQVNRFDYNESKKEQKDLKKSRERDKDTTTKKTSTTLPRKEKKFAYPKMF